MSEETLFEFEAERTGTEAATLLRELADGFEEGTTLTFGDDTVVAAPSTTRVEVEVEREGPADGPAELEVELEFAWSVEPADEGDEDSSGASTDEAGEHAASEESEAEVPDAESPETSTDEEEEDVNEVPVEAADVTSLARFQVYRDRAGEWRWRLVHRNGNIIATGGEGYASRQNARKGLRSVMKNAPGAAVDDETTGSPD